MSDVTEKQGASVEWVTLEDAPNHPEIRQLIPTQRSWYWELAKPEFKRHMVEAGALIKIGKSWRVSLTKAPAAIEALYRKASLEAIDRAARGRGKETRSAALA